MACHPVALFLIACLCLCLLPVSLAIDNGIGLTPPMGWRHWKAFYAHINQDIIEAMMDELTAKYPVDGVPTSLAELGYIYVGLDDHWQNCTVVCPNGTVVPSWKPKPGSNGHGPDYNYQGCVDASGNSVPGSRAIPWYSDGTDPAMGAYGTPQVDKVRFPNMKAMTAKAHSLGLRAGWYMGNYQCSGANNQCNNGGRRGVNCTAWDMPRLVEGSVKALVEYGFDSVKLDSGFGVGSNLTLWAQLFNQSGRPVMMENCHQGGDGPGIKGDARNDHNCSGLTPISDCPFNFWRTTGDPEPGWGTIMREMNSLRKNVNPYYGSGKRGGAPEYNADPPRSRPGGWAYPGTMVVGDGGSVNASGHLNGGMTKDENRVHFGAWCIMSSPMILAYNLSQPARRELVWDIITNKEAIQVNQAWAGHPGAQILSGIGTDKQIEVWTKPLGEGRTAALFVNTASRDMGTAKSTVPAVAAASTNGGAIRMNKCDPKSKSQVWSLSPGATWQNNKVTNVQGLASKGCWEITGCNTHPSAGVGTGFGCKGLPKTCSNTCWCNGAWRMQPNGTIVSFMDGACLTNAGGRVVASPCDPANKGQIFKAVPSSAAKNAFTVQQDGKCVDDYAKPAPPKPTPPPCVPPACTPGGPANVTVSLLDLKLGITGPVRVRSVWDKKDLPNAASSISVSVPHHGCTFLIFMPVGSKWPLPFKLAPWMKAKPPPTPL